MARERTIPLDPSLTNQFGRERERKRRLREKARREFRDRGSTFSLDFQAIDLSNPGKARGKVNPHCKSYAWVPELWSFGKLKEVGAFFLLGLIFGQEPFKWLLCFGLNRSRFSVSRSETECRSSGTVFG